MTSDRDFLPVSRRLLPGKVASEALRSHHPFLLRWGVPPTAGGFPAAFLPGVVMDDSPASFHDYKSPDRNLAWAFRKSRDNWKRKHQALKQDHKRLRNQLRDVRTSRQRWQRRAEQAEHE